jgi:hypothetical protein
MMLRQICNCSDRDRCDAFRFGRRKPVLILHGWAAARALGIDSAIAAQQLRCQANVLSAMRGIRIMCAPLDFDPNRFGSKSNSLFEHDIFRKPVFQSPDRSEAGFRDHAKKL